MTNFLKAKDGTQLAYDFWQGEKEKPGIVLVHMLPSNRSSWRPLVPFLQKEGWSVIAIDYRGRGESGGKLVSPQDFQNIALDVDAAIDFLQQKGIKTIGIVGASIGANHALLAGLRHPSIKSVVLLSPGLDYRGVKVADVASKLGKPLLVVASEDDAYSAQSSKEIIRLAKEPKALKIYSAAGHGTDMLNQPDLIPLLIDWLKKGFG
ncbi:MAG: alpha/beta fold hydrolase [Candidatus Woesearchaeota archaeon]